MATDAAVENKLVMSLEEFKRTSQYLALTENQKAWILKLIATRDARQATMETYKRCAKLGSAYTSQLAGKLAASPKIRAAIARFYDWDDRTKFLNDLEIDIRRAKSADKAALQLVRARVLGLVPGDACLSAAEPEQQNFPIGATIEQGGRLYRVEAVEVTR